MQVNDDQNTNEDLDLALDALAEALVLGEAIPPELEALANEVRSSRPLRARLDARRSWHEVLIRSMGQQRSRPSMSVVLTHSASGAWRAEVRTGHRALGRHRGESLVCRRGVVADDPSRGGVAATDPKSPVQSSLVLDFERFSLELQFVFSESRMAVAVISQDVGVAGVRVRLLDVAQEVVAESTTDQSGQAQLTSILQSGQVIELEWPEGG